MRKSKFSPAQIIRILRETEKCKTIPEFCWEHGLSKATFYRWQSLYGGMEISELERLKQLEAEHRRLKQMYAESRLENTVLKEIIGKEL